MDNVIRNIGDSLIIRINPQITGRVHFTGYTETLVGVTATRTVERNYRISTDNIFWSDWRELNVTNISEETYVTENSLYVEIEYTRTGTDTSGYIQFTNIVFNGTHEEIEFVAPTLMSSIFSNLVGTTPLQSLEQNIFKKLYYRGIVPKYITRGDNNSYTEDKDYVDFFYSVARFFSLIIRFFKRWETMKDDEEMLREQIRGYNIFFNESNVTLSELKYIAGNILSIIQQRGTEMIFVRKGDLLPNGKTAEIDGEAIRLIRSRVCDELVYDAIPKYKMGWCLGNASPLYRGTSRSYNLNKTPDDTQDFSALNKYNTVGSCSLATIGTAPDTKKVIRVTGAGGIEVGSADVSDKLIVADSQMDYEITFAFKVNNTGSSNYTHQITITGVDTGSGINVNYTTTFTLTSSRATAYTSIAQIADELESQGYDKINPLSATGTVQYQSEQVEGVSYYMPGSGLIALESIDPSSQMWHSILIPEDDPTPTDTYSPSTGEGKLQFGVKGYDILKRELNDAFIHQDYRQVGNSFVDEYLSKFQTGVWYWARGIIHAYDTEVSTNDKTNLGFGQDLVFNNYFLKYIFPEISITGGEIDIWDYKVRPLVRGKNIRPLRDGSVDARSLGFIQAYTFFYTYFRNNNNSQSVSDITDAMERYLYPFNTINLFTVLSNS